MNKLYAKTVLYLYPCIDKVTEQIDELLLKKALSSGSDFSPCISQCEKMVELGVHNARLIELKAEVKKILCDFTEEENAIFGYRYFHEKKKSPLCRPLRHRSAAFYADFTKCVFSPLHPLRML